MQRVGVLLAALLAVAAGVMALPGAADARPGFVETPQVAVGDSDGDGLAEASVAGVAGGPCACWCPILRGRSQLATAGQTVGVESRSAAVLCGTRVVTTVDPDAPDPDRAPGIDGGLEFNPGGFGRLPRR